MKFNGMVSSPTLLLATLISSLTGSVKQTAQFIELYFINAKRKGGFGMGGGRGTAIQNAKDGLLLFVYNVKTHWRNLCNNDSHPLGLEWKHYWFSRHFRQRHCWLVTSTVTQNPGSSSRECSRSVLYGRGTSDYHCDNRVTGVAIGVGIDNILS